MSLTLSLAGSRGGDAVSDQQRRRPSKLLSRLLRRILKMRRPHPLHVKRQRSAPDQSAPLRSLRALSVVIIVVIIVVNTVVNTVVNIRDERAPRRGCVERLS